MRPTGLSCTPQSVIVCLMALYQLTEIYSIEEAQMIILEPFKEVFERYGL
jgi:hypothetical protein